MLENGILVFSELPKGESDFTIVLTEIDNDRSTYLAPLTIEVKLEKSGTEYKFYCKYDTIVELKCDRCLCSYPYPVSEEKSFLIGNVESNHFDEFDIREFPKQIDIGEFIEEEIIMDLPPQRICDESCKGLCDSCGADLNNDNCKCNDII